MAIGIIGDIHLGPKCERSGIKVPMVNGMYRCHQKMIADFRERGIRTILLTGDVFTNHTFMTVDVMAYAIKLFRDDMKDFDIHVVAGNHDYLYDNKESLTSLQLLELIPNVHVYRSGIETLTLLNRTWYMCPWVFPDRMDAFESWLGKLARKSKDEREHTVLFGHFDIIGCLMEAGQIAEAGTPAEKFYKAANYTISGHYHCMSFNKGPDPDASILYAGSPYHLSFAHVDTKCGYYVVDEDSKGKLTYEFIENVDSPRFVDVSDDKLEGLGDLSNCFVRYCYLNSREAVDAADRKKKLLEAKPLYVKSVPYGGDVSSVEEARKLDDEETRQFLEADSLTLVGMFMDKNPEEWPTFWSGEDPKEKILGILASYDKKHK